MRFRTAMRQGTRACAWLVLVRGLNRSTKFDVLVRVHNFVVLRENVQKNEKSFKKMKKASVLSVSDHS